MLIIDSGEESTYIVPIVDYYILEDSIERTNLAGHHVTQNLIDFLHKMDP